MFDTTKFSDRVADALDLLIDFATLGEYGLEPVERRQPNCAARRRTAPIRAANADRAARRAAR